jgi:Ca2+-binding RTX toxin-like protein
MVDWKTEVKFDELDVNDKARITTTTTIQFSDGSTMTIRKPWQVYEGERSNTSLQMLGAESEYIQTITTRDLDRVGRERFELIDALRDGRMRVVPTGNGAMYLNYQEGTEQDDALFGGGMLNGLAGNDVLTGSNDIYSMDVLDGGGGADTLNGGQGMDILVGGAGADHINGGDNFDIASYAPASAGLVVNMANVAQNTGDAAGDSYASVEGIVGS